MIVKQEGPWWVAYTDKGNEIGRAHTEDEAKSIGELLGEFHE